MSKNNNHIVEQLRTGDNQKAIAKLYQAFHGIHNFIRNNGGDEADAQDVFQDALLVLYRNAQKPEFELTCAAGTYLYSVSRFIWKDVLKKRNKEVKTEFEKYPNEVIISDVERFQEQQLQTSKLAGILEQLGNKCKMLLQA